MAHSKFNALADRILQRRLDHLIKIEPHSTVLERGEEAQLPLAFPPPGAPLHIYPRFDEQSREVEWSFYSRKGEFLLHFAFSLKDHSFQIYSVHPSLWMATSEMNSYLEAIKTHLCGQFPPLTLVKGQDGSPSIQRL